MLEQIFKDPKDLKKFFTRERYSHPTFEQLGPEIQTNSTLFLFCLFICFFFLLELPQTTRTKVTPASKYPIKIKVYKVVPKKISDFTPI